MSDEKNLKEQFNILFDDLDKEAEDAAVKAEENDEKVKEFFSDAFADKKEKAEDYSFDSFEAEDTEEKKPAPSVKEPEPKKALSEEEERTRRKIYEMGRDEDEEFPSFDAKEKEKNAEPASKASLKKESTRFWIFTAIIGALTVAAILFILFSRGILGGGSKDTEPAGTDPQSTEAPDTVSPTDPEESDTESASDEPSSEEPSTEEQQVPADAGLTEILKKYPNLFVVDPDKVSSELRVRSEPDTSLDNVKAKLSRTAGGNVEAVEGDWLKISSGSYSGYVKADLCLTGNAAKIAVIPNIHREVEIQQTAKIRRAPDTTDGSDTGERAPAGAVYTLIAEEGEFYKISYNETERYVAKSVALLRYSIDEAVAP